jgi:hypothetical protein
MNHDDALAHHRLNRSPARQAELLAAAERLIEMHEARRPKRTTTNAVADDAQAGPTPEEQDRDNMIVALVRRLATRDETGAGSGEPG